MHNRFSKGLIAILAAAVFMGVTALPPGIKAKLPDVPVVRWFKAQKVTLGLDLQGGTQLDYRIDLSKAIAKNSDDDSGNDVQINDIIEGVRATIERRVNNLGVSEPQIFTSNVGGEWHIIVELAGIKDIEEAKKIVGKTIQLEFKEPKETAEASEKEVIKKQAQAMLKTLTARGADFVALAGKAQTDDKKVIFRDNQKEFASQLPDHYKDVFKRLKPGSVNNAVIEGSDGYVIRGQNQVVKQEGYYLVQFIGKGMTDRTTEEADDFATVAKEVTKAEAETLTTQRKSDLPAAFADKLFELTNGGVSEVAEADGALKLYKLTSKSNPEPQVRASHILLAYKGAERAPAEVTRSKRDAQKEAEAVLKKVKEDPALFGRLTAQYSDDPGSKQNQGDLGFFARGQMTAAFEETAFRMQPGDIVKRPVETEFGFHIIKMVERNDNPEVTVDLQVMSLPVTEANRAKLEAARKRVEKHSVTKKEEQFEFRELVYDLSPDPWKATGLDGSRFKFASVSYDQLGNPVVDIRFDDEGAKLFEDLTGRLTGKPMAIFVGGDLISQPRVNEKIAGGNAVISGSFDLKSALALANDLNTGAIDAPIVLSGQRTISATLGENALKVSVYAGALGLLCLVLFMVLYYRLLGVFAVIALGIYSIIIVFLLNVTPIVMTLAGIAGIILSIGMAVDANILIFERTKEEIRSGKPFASAIQAGFERAWSSIRDSNASSLITCAILWFFGNSIIRGFALMLALGILVSMFTAINVTRALIRTIAGTRAAEGGFLLGARHD